jgi:hypothetical protein
MKVDDQPGYGKTNFKGGSPLAMENSKTSYLKNKMILEDLKKKISITNPEALLDENLLKD